MAATFCDPTIWPYPKADSKKDAPEKAGSKKDAPQSKAKSKRDAPESRAQCNFPDRRVLDLSKGTNPQFLAHQANRVRFQRAMNLNREIDQCDSNLAECAWAPAKNEHSIKQKITQQLAIEEIDITRRSHTDYAASTHQGRMKGNERNMRFFRDVQRDERQCLQYGTRCGMLQGNGNPKARDPKDTMTYGLSSKFYNGKKWKVIGSDPSWKEASGKDESGALRTHELRMNNKKHKAGKIDRTTLGYEDM